MLRLILAFCTFLPLISIGQITKNTGLLAKDVKGRVTCAADKSPIIGGTVLVKGTTKGVVTDIDGNYSIKAEANDVLVFSCIGFEPQTIVVKASRVINVMLNEETKNITELVVVGYGKQDRRSITGAVSTVKAEKLQKIATSLDNALLGKVAGLHVASSSGVPGSATLMSIRGISTLYGENNSPLYVIDGVPIYGTGRDFNNTSFNNSSVKWASMNGGNEDVITRGIGQEFEKNPLANLNPDDIESIEVLKDAFSTAIYGSRGANGVILITTKKGSREKVKVDIQYSTTISNPLKLPKLLNGEEYSQVYNAYYKPYGVKFTATENTNWLDQVIRPAYSHNVNASLSGGSEKSSYYFSLSGINQEAYIKKNSFERYSSRLNIESKLSKKFTFGTSINVSFTRNNSLNAQSVFREAAMKAPNLAIYNADGSYKYGYEGNAYGNRSWNPVAKLNNTAYSDDYRTVANMFLEYSPFTWLSLKSELGTDFLATRTYSRQAETPDLKGGQATESNGINRKVVVNNTANFQKSIGMHLLQGVVGQSYETSVESRNGLSGTGFMDDKVLSIGSAETKKVMAANTQKWALISAFVRFNYMFNGRYMLGATYRLDGSSRFNRDNRYVGTPSFSAGWKLSEESFFKQFKFIDEIKLRASYGLSRVDGSGGYYGNVGQYTSVTDVSYNGTPILGYKQPGNPYLRWEKTNSTDIGLDLSFLQRRITFQVDYYYKKTTDMLYASSVPLFMGISSQPQNIGDMENQGFEVSINTVNYSSKDFTWTTNVNLFRNVNKILKLNFSGADPAGADRGYKYFKEGQAAGQFYLYEWAGVDPKTGNSLWVWADGTVNTTPPASDSKKGPLNRKVFGTALPKIAGGFTNSFRYKNFDLNVLFSFSYGNKMMNGTNATLLTYTTLDANNLSKDILNYWKINGHNTSIPKLNNSSIVMSSGGTMGTDHSVSRQSSRFLEDASYLRLKNIELAYTLDTKMSKLKFFDYVKAFVACSNVFTITSYSGLDPEVSAFGSSAVMSGYDELTMPQTRTVQVGLKFGL